MSKNLVENTEKKDPEALLFEAMLNPRHIEDMEARGTKQLAASSVLPSQGLVTFQGGYMEKYRGWHEKAGIKILGRVEGDDLFVNVELPPGWSQRNDSPYWNTLLDDKGRQRASIFYKAAFYDRSAHIHPMPRFVASYAMKDEREIKGPCFGVVRDSGTEIFRTAEIPMRKKYDDALWTDSEGAYEQAKQWLSSKYPNHEDVNAYWDGGES